MFAAPSAAWADALDLKYAGAALFEPDLDHLSLRRSSCWPPQVLQAMRLALTPLFNIMFRAILDPLGRRARDDKETTTTSSPLDGIGCWTYEVIATVQVFLENREYHLKIAPGDHLKTWKTWINLLEII